MHFLPKRFEIVWVFVILSKLSPYFAYSKGSILMYRYMENSLFMIIFLLIIIPA